MTPAATVALRMLGALGVTTVEQAREILALWCRPSPRLAPADVRAILAAVAAGSRTDKPDEPVELDEHGNVVVRDETGRIIGYGVHGEA